MLSAACVPGCCRLDPSNPALKYHQVEQLGSKWRESREVDMEALAQVPQETSSQVRGLLGGTILHQSFHKHIMLMFMQH